MRAAKFLLSAPLLLLVSFAKPALAAGYGPAGCGLGSMLIGKDPGLSQVLAATTNGTSYTQTFGISSGTSNCVPAQKAAAFQNQREFMANNLASLSQETAQGEGETLRAFTMTLGCDERAFADVAKTMQAHHATIFGVAGVDDILFATHETLRGSAKTSSACSNII